jgi:hypothetical protein
MLSLSWHHTWSHVFIHFDSRSTIVLWLVCEISLDACVNLTFLSWVKKAHELASQREPSWHACQERGRDSPWNFLGIHEHALDPFQGNNNRKKQTFLARFVYSKTDWTELSKLPNSVHQLVGQIGVTNNSTNRCMPFAIFVRQEEFFGIGLHILYTAILHMIFCVLSFLLLLERDLRTITKTTLMLISIWIWKLHHRCCCSHTLCKVVVQRSNR